MRVNDVIEHSRNSGQQKYRDIYGHKAEVNNRKATDNGACNITQNQNSIGPSSFVAKITHEQRKNDLRQIVDQQRNAEAQSRACPRQDIPAQCKWEQARTNMWYTFAK